MTGSATTDDTMINNNDIKRSYGDFEMQNLLCHTSALKLRERATGIIRTLRFKF